MQVAGEDIKKGSVYEKLVDHKNYISAHRHRFDNGGIGRGIGPNMPTGAGRLGRMLEREFTLGMHQLTRPNYGGAAVLKDPNLTTDVIQSLAKRAPPVRFCFCSLVLGFVALCAASLSTHFWLLSQAYMKPVHRGRSVDSMQPLKPKFKFDRLRGCNAGFL